MKGGGRGLSSCLRKLQKMCFRRAEETQINLLLLLPPLLLLIITCLWLEQQVSQLGESRASGSKGGWPLRWERGSRSKMEKDLGLQAMGY